MDSLNKAVEDAHASVSDAAASVRVVADVADTEVHTAIGELESSLHAHLSKVSAAARREIMAAEQNWPLVAFAAFVGAVGGALVRSVWG